MDNLSASAFTRALLAQARQRRAPLMGCFELTGRCNLSCVMCYVRKPAGDAAAKAAELPAQRWIDIARQACGEGLFFLQLTGGEILLRPDFFDIYHGVSDQGVKLSLSTNATLITPEIARRLGQRPPRVAVVTLYGGSRETYARVCGNADGFDRTMEGIRLLRENGIVVELQTTLVQGNHKDLEAIYSVAAELGLRFKMTAYTMQNRTGAETCPHAHRLTPAERWQAASLLDRLKGIAPKVSSGTEDIHRMVEDARDSASAEGARKTAFPCAAGNFSFAIQWTGKMTACVLLDEPSVSLEGKSFGQAWEELKAACDAVPCCDDCERCDMRKECGVCAARLYGETGAFDQKAELLCEYARLASGRTQ